MNISYKWLKEYVDFDLTPQKTAEVLTSCGLEVDSVEEVQTIKGGLKGLYVGEVLTCEAHPNSDHLHITTVDLGKGEPSQIVCGAPNVAARQKVIVADVGAVLYDGDNEFVIKKSKLRGVESFGMICAEDEIGVGTAHDGIIVLPADAKVGQPAAEYYQLESDWLIEIDITANHADALSHYGVARDLYAWLVQNGYETTLKRPSCDAFVVDNNDLPIDVTIENNDACKRYACVSITDCEVKESPEWLQNKLLTIGLRPINNIVDITNYIMMAYGQPMHCFDADMVKGHHIIVKTQPEGTKFVTLDGEEHTLGPSDLSICNAEEPMCIAGVGLVDGAFALRHELCRTAETQCFVESNVSIGLVSHKLAAAYLAECDARAVVGVDICRYFEDEARKFRFSGLHFALFGHSGLGAWSNLHKTIEQFLNTKVVKRTTKEHGRNMPCTIGFHLKFGVNAVYQLQIIAKFLRILFANVFV